MSRRAFTLAEVAIALGVIAVITGAIASSGVTRMRDGQIARAIQEVDLLAKATQQFPITVGQLDYTGVSVPQLVANGLVPGALASGAANPWGAGYTVAAASGAPTRFAIAIDGLPDWASSALQNTFARRASAAAGAGSGGSVLLTMTFDG